MNKSLLFAEETCKESLMCGLDTEQCNHWPERKKRFIYNKDIITDFELRQNTGILDLDKPYYELVIAASDKNHWMNKYELESLGFSKDMKIFMPWSHDLWRYRSNDLGSIEREAHCCLCGGQLFIIFQVENGVRKIIEKRF